MTTQNEKYLNEQIRTIKKLILIENLNELDLKPKKKKEFITFYFNNLHMNLLDAFDIFKSTKKNVK